MLTQNSIHHILKIGIYLLSAKKTTTFAQLYCWLVYSGTQLLVETSLFQRPEIFFPQGENSILLTGEIYNSSANNIAVKTFGCETRDVETQVSS